jgi:nicotinamide-nucleotide amidase
MSIANQVRRVAVLLKQKSFKVVFAESCTAGLVAASLARVPGISEHHCGGMVVYRNATKEAYLGISARLLKNPGAVSEAVAREMAVRVLQLTPEADISAAVTGHLGPGAPADMDGVAFIAISVRRTSTSKLMSKVVRHRCRASVRLARQKEVANEVLGQLASVLETL